MSDKTDNSAHEQPKAPLDLDADDHNADWLRLLAERNGQLPPSPFAPSEKEQPNGRQQPQ